MATKKKNKNLNMVNTYQMPNWKYCVSISSGGFLSTNWTEHFFDDDVECDQFKADAKEQGYAILVVTPDQY